MGALNLDLIKPVLFPLDPIPGETIRGYAGRVAEHNAYGDAADLLVYAGIGIRDFWLGKSDATVLARIYGVDADKLEAMVPKGLAGAEPGTTVYGLQAGPRTFHQVRCPVSPTGLRKSTHHRFSWSMGRLPFCSEDWSLLVDQCPIESCRAQLKWHKGPIHICSRCRFDLRDVEPSYILEEDRPYLSVAADLVSFDHEIRLAAAAQLPEFLRELTPEDVFSAALIIGKSLRYAGYPMAVPPSVPPNYPVAMLAGMRFILGSLPGGGESFQREMPGRLIARARDQLNKRVLAAHGPVRRALKLAHGQTCLFGRASTVTITFAASTLGVGRSVVRQLINKGLLRSHTSGGGEARQHDDVDAASLAELECEVRSRISRQQLSEKYKLWADVVEGVLAKNGIVPLRSPMIDLVYKDAQFPRSAAIECLDRMERSIVRVASDEPCRVSVRSIFGTDYYRGAAWTSLLVGGAIPDGLGSFAPEGLDLMRLNVSVRGAQMIRADGPQSSLPCEDADRPMTLSEAEVRLECNPRDVQRLLRVGVLLRKENGLCRLRTSECRQALISSREFARGVGFDAADLSAFAKANGLDRPFPGIGFWSRRHAEALLPPSEPKPRRKYKRSGKCELALEPVVCEADRPVYVEVDRDDPAQQDPTSFRRSQRAVVPKGATASLRRTRRPLLRLTGSEDVLPMLRAPIGTKKAFHLKRRQGKR